MSWLYNAKGFLKAARDGDDKALAKYAADPRFRGIAAAKDENGDTALHLLARRGEAAMMEQLAKAGVPVNEKNAAAKTALCLALEYNQYYSHYGHLRAAMAQALVKSGADPNIYPWASSAPLALAVHDNNTGAARALLDGKADPDTDRVLMKAVAGSQVRGRESIAMQLLQAGAKTELYDSKGRHPLHLAAANGGTEAVAFMLDAGADINMTDGDGQTPLHKAVMEGQVSTVELLLTRGARIDIKDKYQLTALAWARKKDNAPICGLMEAVAGRVPAEGAPPQADENWVMLSPDKIAHVGVYPSVERKITEVFNFKSRQHLVIAENLKTGAESITPPQSFDSMEEQALRDACNAFRKLGGEPDERAVFGTRVLKKILKH